MERNKQELFESRTQKHIQMVRRNLEKFENFQGLTLLELRQRGWLHDRSKFSDSEINAYTELTWCYHTHNFEQNEEVKHLIAQGLKNHALKNRHHPEAHEDVNSMTILDLVEMIADWTAIAQENGKTSCHEWAEQNITNKWSFSEEKKRFIFKLIQEMDHRNQHAE